MCNNPTDKDIQKYVGQYGYTQFDSYKEKHWFGHFHSNYIYANENKQIDGKTVIDDKTHGVYTEGKIINMVTLKTVDIKGYQGEQKPIKKMNSGEQL